MDLPTSDTSDPTVERSVLLDADLEAVLDAIDRPDLLSAWLGEWHAGDADTARVVTDDGVERDVELLAPRSATERRWRWSPVGHPDAWSDVVLTVAVEHGRTRLTVTETLSVAARASQASTSGAAGVPAVRWLPSLLALGAVLAVGSLVAV